MLSRSTVVLDSEPVQKLFGSSQRNFLFFYLCEVFTYAHNGRRLEVCTDRDTCSIFPALSSSFLLAGSPRTTRMCSWWTRDAIPSPSPWCRPEPSTWGWRLPSATAMTSSSHRMCAECWCSTPTPMVRSTTSQRSLSRLTKIRCVCEARA